MSELGTQLLTLIVKSTSGKQFTFLIKLIIFFVSVITATALYSHFFINEGIDLSLEVILKTLLSPLTIVWMIFFLILYFGIYPLLCLIVFVVYRMLHPAEKTLASRQLTGARKGFKIAGANEAFNKLKKLPIEKIHEANIALSVEVIQEENKIIESLSFILIILIQYIVFHSSMMNSNMTLLIIFIILSVVLLLIIFFFTPWLFKIYRALISDYFKRLLKDAEKMQGQTRPEIQP
ncbi:MAG: hypothetical protein GC171_02205 [Terrimonas sp.]|nr:hypothetical protein [Terrimonas sp.]